MDGSRNGLERMAISKDVLTAHLQGEAVLLHLDTKQYYRLNETGAAIWRCREEGIDLADIASQLVAEFDVDLATAKAEVQRVLGELRERRLVEP